MDTAREVTLSPAARSYAWRELARRAGIPAAEGAVTGFESISLPVYYGSPDSDLNSGPGLYVLPCRPEAWGELLDLPPGGLPRLPAEQVFPSGSSLPLAADFPLLFASPQYETGRPPVEILPGGKLVFAFDLLAAAVFLLARWEETVLPERDNLGRFPGERSTAYRQGFLDRPVLDEWAVVLRAWLCRLLPGWQPAPRAFSVTLSHDIDVLSLPLGKGLKLAAQDWLKRKNPRLAAQTLINLLHPARPDPYLEGIDLLLRLSSEQGMKSIFFFQAAAPSRFDDGYDIASPLARKVLARVEAAGFEVGLHPGYYAPEHPEWVAQEKARLDAVLARPARAVRQHFLRVDVPRTWRVFEQAGFVLDSSLTYSDQEGFRCGTCHPYPLFDLAQDRELRLWEHPLVVMEGTLRQYRGLTLGQAYQRILELAGRCRQVGGDFTLLWHNSSFSREWSAWRQGYFEIVPALAQLQREAGAGGEGA